MLILKNISKKYNKVILNNFNYQFGDGIYAIKGGSGKGKTTLLDILYGEVKQDSGEIFIDGIETPYAKLKKVIFFSYLKSYSLLNLSKSFNANIKSFKRNSLVEIDSYLLNYLIEYFNFKKMVDEPLFNLSGGQIKLANIIFTLSKKSYFYLLDEPFSDLDEENKSKVKDVIESKLKNKCVIIVNHENEAIGFDYTGIIDFDKGEVSSKETTCSFNEEYCKIPIKSKNKLIILLNSLKDNLAFNLMFLFLTLLCVVSSVVSYAYMPLSSADHFNVSIKNDPYTYEKVVDPSAKYDETYNVGDYKYLVNLSDVLTIYSFNIDGGKTDFDSLNNVYLVTSEEVDKPTLYNSDANNNIDFASLFNEIDYKEDNYKGFDSYYFETQSLENAVVLEISGSTYNSLIKSGNIKNLKNAQGELLLNENACKGFYIASGIDFLKFYQVEFIDDNDKLILPIEYENQSNVNLLLDSFRIDNILRISDIDVSYGNVDKIQMSLDRYFKILTTMGIQNLFVNKDEIHYFTDYLNFEIPTLPLYIHFFETDTLFFVVSLIALILAIVFFVFLVGFTCYFKLKKPLTKEIKSRLKLYNFSNFEIKLYDYFAIILSAIVSLVIGLPVACQQTFSVNTLIRKKYFGEGYSTSTKFNKYTNLSLVMFKEIDVLTILNTIMILIVLITFIIVITNLLRKYYVRTKGNK